MATVTDALATALDFHRSGDRDRAEQLYRQILQQDPNHAEALHWLGAIAYQNGDYDGAIASIQRAIERNGSQAVFHNTIGMVYRAKGELDSAVRHYRQALALQPNNGDIFKNLTHVLHDWFARNPQEAIAIATSLAQQFHRANTHALSESLYRQILQYDPDRAEAIHGLGLVAFQQGQVDRAIGLYEQAIQRDREAAIYYNNLGLAYRSKGQVQAELRSYWEALRLEPHNAPIQENLTHTIEKIIQANPEAGKGELLKTAAYFHRVERRELAHRCYQRCLKLEPDNRDALYGLGLLAYQEGQPNRAVERFTQLLQLEPNNAEYHNQLGLAYKTNSQPQAARQNFQKALELQPDNEHFRENLNATIGILIEYLIQTSQWHFNSGNLDRVAQLDSQAGTLLKESGQIDAALRYYDRALEAKPDFAEVHHTLAELYLERQELDRAIRHAKRAIEAKPDFAEAYKSLGNAFVNQRNGGAALRAYARAIQHKPDYAEVYSNIGSVYFLQNKYKEAVEVYRKAISINDQLPGIHWNLGKVFEKVRQFKPTIECWQKAIELDPEFPGAQGYYQLGTKYLATGKREEAARSYQKALQLKPDLADAYWDLCEIFNLGNQPLARQTAAQFCKNVGDNAQILAAMAFMKANVNSGATEVAKQKFLELESMLYRRIDELSDRDTIRLYLNVLFDMPHLRDDVAANSQLAHWIAKRYVALLAKRSQAENYQPKQFALTQERVNSPLRIGFLSQHFRRHSVGWLSADILQELSKLTPHLYCYVTGQMKTDNVTQRFEQFTEKVHRPKTFTARELTAEIHKDDLDVLVDLDSVTVMVHTEILYRRPAPVCVSWLGFDAPYISDRNYYLGDWYTHPQGAESHYLERVARMPDSFAAVSGLPIHPTDRVVLRRSMRLSANQTVYLCIATGNKFCPEMISAQVNILKQVPDSVLLYKGRVGDLKLIESMYHQECKRQGIRTNRMRVLPRTRTEEEHRLIYQMADVLLDSYPYSGSTHIVEALWFNMPVVAKVAEQSFGRQAYSLMKGAGTDAGVAWDWDEYIKWGVRLGRDDNLRSQVRAQLAQGKQPDRLAPLWNPKKFAWDMYQVLKQLLAQQLA